MPGSNDLNSILLEGKLAADPECRTDGERTEVCTFEVESRRAVKKTEGHFSNEVCFFNIQTAGRLAEVCGEYLKAGRVVRVVGRLKQEQTGARQVVIIAEHVEFKPIAKTASRKKVDELIEEAR